VPHVINVDELVIGDADTRLACRRRIFKVVEKLGVPLPALLTISDDYRPRTVPPTVKPEVRANAYRGKVFDPYVWNCEKIGADPSSVGLAGSPTIVGPGYEVGGPRVRKMLGKSMFAKRDIEALSFSNKTYGPFKRGAALDNLDGSVKDYLLQSGAAGFFDYSDLLIELFGEKVELG
jgi:electron transfer flavoprotein beta subunit